MSAAEYPKEVSKIDPRKYILQKKSATKDVGMQNNIGIGCLNH